MKLTEVKDLVAQEAGYADWLNIENSDLEDHEITEIQANLLNRVAELYAEKVAIVFADYVENLKPNQRVSVWSKNGEFNGMFNMDNEQLFKQYKTSKAK